MRKLAIKRTTITTLDTRAATASEPDSGKCDSVYCSGGGCTVTK